MATTLAQRIFVAHLEISYRLGRKVTLEEFGRLVARQMGRRAPFSAAAVSRWEAGTQTPTPDVIEAIAAVSGPPRTARSAARRTSPVRSAPVHPRVRSASDGRSTSRASGILAVAAWRMRRRPASSGTGV